MQRGPIGVVLPGYGHPQFLVEAVVSACEQDIDAEVKVVVVDDGCRFEETGEVIQNLMRSYPGKLHYLRQKNTRLPGARNAGIRFLLKLEPELDAIYFLDADNRISHYSLRHFRETLGDDPSIGWAYPDIAFFGLTWSEIGIDVRETAPQYSRLKHLAGNISEAGSMVRADVFRNGVFFDETMRSGFEDWDFWLSALEAGYRGVRAEHSGFMYRRRPESMLAESRRFEDELIARLRRKHSSLFTPRSLMRLEHDEAPYFAIFLTDTDRVILSSDPCLPGVSLTKAEFADRCKQWFYDPRESFFPAQLICVREAAWNALLEIPQWLRWFFWVTKERSKQCEIYRLQAGRQPKVLEARRSEVEMSMSLLSIDAEVLRDFAAKMKDPDWYESLVISCFSAALPGLQDTNCAPQSFVHACEDIGPFVSQVVKATGQRTSCIDRRYAGPDGRIVRSDLIGQLCAEEEHKPFPCASGTQRILVAAHYKVLQSKEGGASFVKLLKRLAKEKVEVLLSLELDDGFDFEKLEPEAWLGLVSDIVPIKIGKTGQAYRMYLGRRIDVLPSGFNKLAASIVSRSVDAVITLGAPVFLQVLGLARAYGVKGYVLLDNAYMEVGQVNQSKTLSTILAFEHAEEYLVTDEEAIKNMMSAEGVPPSKFIGHDDFLDRALWEK